ncbi:MAG: lysine--tRNA ligase [Rickettsiaceae bacterium]|nr:lysine--tRNA ligase [Rickettsiaceae bacterium]
MNILFDQEQTQIARNSSAWPFIEAFKILDKIKGKTPKKGYVLFETGYGPSGLPHIGTFAEVARTLMVKHAFGKISDIPTKLICFSDDLDGLRKVPTNVPNPEMVAKYMNMPLTSIPDPFGEKESYGHYMNAKLCSFLDAFGFQYEFMSATTCYKRGDFDHILNLVIDKYEDIMGVMLPSLREERASNYSPFMPICPETGQVLQVPVLEVKKDSKTIIYRNLSDKLVETEVTQGKCKLQWKPDFGMRWAALDVDYEMYGKDHMPNAGIYSNICSILGGTPPAQFFYELFLDEAGAKISKSKGNSISIDDWLKYGPLESVSLFVYNSPSKAKKLYFDVIPKNVDEYITFGKKFHQEEDFAKKIASPLFHIHNGNVPLPQSHNISFSLLLNLASVCNSENKGVLWGFISNYEKGLTPENSPYLDDLVKHAVNYYNDFVKLRKNYLTPNEKQTSILMKIRDLLISIPSETSAEDIQTKIYDIGMEAAYENLRDYFKEIYMILLGQEEGPRLGTFFKLYGIENTIKLIEEKLPK